MALPDAGPATLPDVKAYVSILSPADTIDDNRLTRIVAAVNDLVRDLPIADDADGLDNWPARVVEGATMLAGRIWRRKDSPSGVDSFGAFGPVYVQRNDPDVAQLLRMGQYARPTVG